MSTKRIEEALELLLGMQHESSTIVGQHIGRLVPEARAEVGAIKQAAKDILNEDTESADTAKCGPAMDAYTAGMDLLESIAKESP
jgi:hypothetical protein